MANKKMIFMIDSDFGRTLTGVESAQIDRLQTFEYFHQPAMTITVWWGPKMHENIRHFGIKEEQFTNLFDFFQNSRDGQVIKTQFTPEQVPIYEGYEKDETISDEHYWAFKKDGQIRQEIFMYEGTTDRVARVAYRNRNQQTVITDSYDWRGFLSRRAFFYLQERQLVESKAVYFSPAGEEKIIVEYGSAEFDKHTSTTVRLFNYHGHDYWFASEMALRRFFFDEINREYGCYNAFISDRGLVSDWAVLNMKTPAFKTMYIHSTLVNDYRHPDTARDLNYNYEYALQWPELWTNMLAPTQFHVDQTLKRYGDRNDRVYRVPVGVIPQAVMVLPKIAMADRQPHSVMTFARLGLEKLIDLQIRAVALVKKSFPDVHLHIYGEGEKGPSLRKLAQQLDVTENVTFYGWYYDKPKAYHDKQIYISTSNTEAFGISMLEAISFGLPVLTTPVESVHDLTIDGKTGYILPDPNNNQDAVIANLAEKIVALFSHPEKLQAMSDATYQFREKYDFNHLWQDWQPFLKDLQNSNLIQE